MSQARKGCTLTDCAGVMTAAGWIIAFITCDHLRVLSGGWFSYLRIEALRIRLQLSVLTMFCANKTRPIFMGLFFFSFSWLAGYFHTGIAGAERIQPFFLLRTPPLSSAPSACPFAAGVHRSFPWPADRRESSTRLRDAGFSGARFAVGSGIIKRIINGPMWFAQALLMFHALPYWRVEGAVAAARRSPQNGSETKRADSNPAIWWVREARWAVGGSAAPFCDNGKIVPVRQECHRACKSDIFFFQLHFPPVSHWGNRSLGGHDWIRRGLNSSNARDVIRGPGGSSVPLASGGDNCWHAQVKEVGKANFGGGLGLACDSLRRFWEPLVGLGNHLPHGCFSFRAKNEQ